MDIEIAILSAGLIVHFWIYFRMCIKPSGKLCGPQGLASEPKASFSACLLKRQMRLNYL